MMNRTHATVWLESISVMGEEPSAWLDKFHAGDRVVLESCYRDHYQAVAFAVGSMLSPVDAENVIHDVFFSLISDERIRRGFRGGSLSAWLRTVARNRAIDFIRRQRQEQNLDSSTAESLVGTQPAVSEERTDARNFITEFQQKHLPEKWRAVFEARFIRQMTQHEAAAATGLGRTTLAYQEHRIRRLLRKHLQANG